MSEDEEIDQRHAAVSELVANQTDITEEHLRSASSDAVEAIAEALLEDFSANETNPETVANDASADFSPGIIDER